MKKLFLLILILLGSVRVWAYDFSFYGSNGYLYFDIVSEEDKTVEMVPTSSIEYEYSSYYNYGIIVPETVEYDGVTYRVIGIGDGTFKYANDVEIVTLSEGLEYIGAEAFRYSGVKELTIPASVTRIDFAGMGNIKEIHLAEGNKAYKAQEGVLFSADMKQLLLYTQGKSDLTYNIPDGVQTLGTEAFVRNDSLYSVQVPSSVEKLNSATFVELPFLYEMIIDNGKNLVIDEDAFVGCDKLSSVLFMGNTPPTSASEYPFGAQSVAVTVPESSLSAYKTAFSQAKDIDICALITTDDAPFIYRTYGTGKVALLSCQGSHTAERLEVPAEIEYQGTKYKVVRADCSAFKGLKCKSIVLPASMTEIATSKEGLYTQEGTAFMTCTDLESIVVEEGNTAYKTVDGVLFSADGTQLLAYPANRSGETYTVSDAQTIHYLSFYGTRQLKTLYLGDQVTTVQSSAICNWQKLSEIHFGTGISLLEENALMPNIENDMTLYFVNRDTAPYVAGAFDGMESYNTTIQLPFGCKNTYMEAMVSLADGDEPVEADWNNYSSWLEDEYQADDNLSDSPVIYGMISYEDRTVQAVGLKKSKESVNLNIPGKVKINGIEYSVIAIGEDAFLYKNLGHATLAPTIQTIGERAFYFCSFEGELVLPDSLTELGYEAFYQANLTGTLRIPAKLKLVGYDVFCQSKLDAFEVAKENVWMQAIDGLLYNISSAEDSLTLINCPGNYQGSLVMPDSVKVIGNSAFECCEKLISVKTWASRIEDYAFNECYALDTLDFICPLTFGRSVVNYTSPSYIFIRSEQMATPLLSYGIPFNLWSDSDSKICVPYKLLEEYKNDDIWKNNSRCFWGMRDKLKFSDNSDYTNADNLLVDTMTVTLNFSNTNWRSSCLPFAIPEAVLTANGIEASELKYVDEASNGNVMIDFARVLSGETPQRHPLLIKSASGDSVVFTLNNVALYGVEETQLNYETTNYNITFTSYPVSFPAKGIEGSYVVGGGKLGKCSTTATMPANRWYMSCEAKSESMSAPVFHIGLIEMSDGHATELSAIEHQDETDTPVYNLQGARISSAIHAPGLYVKNGKMILVK